MDNPTDPIIIVTWISSVFGFLGLTVGSIFTYLAVVQNSKKRDEAKEKTQPLKPIGVDRITDLEQFRREDGEAYVISIQNKEREIQDLNNIIAAHQVWNLRLTRQLKKYAPGISPAGFESPSEYE